jgi:prevent-host-death family protein
MRAVTVREVNRSFSRILKAAESGETVLITRRGEPVAVIAPHRAPDCDRGHAVEHIVALMRKGLPLGRRRFSHDEMHERRTSR